MSIYLPLGIALFQAANTQFLYHASRQRQFAHVGSLEDRETINIEQAQELSNSRWKRLVASSRRANSILLFIGGGLAVQVRGQTIGVPLALI